MQTIAPAVREAGASRGPVEGPPCAPQYNRVLCDGPRGLGGPKLGSYDAESGKKYNTNRCSFSGLATRYSRDIYLYNI